MAHASIVSQIAVLKRKDEKSKNLGCTMLSMVTTYTELMKTTLDNICPVFLYTLLNYLVLSSIAMDYVRSL